MFLPAVYRTELAILALGKENFLAASANPQRCFIVCHHLRKQHLNCQFQRMEVPYYHGMLTQLNVVGRRVTGESREANSKGFLRDGIFSVLIQIMVV